MFYVAIYDALYIYTYVIRCAYTHIHTYISFIYLASIYLYIWVTWILVRAGHRLDLVVFLEPRHGRSLPRAPRLAVETAQRQVHVGRLSWAATSSDSGEGYIQVCICIDIHTYMHACMHVYIHTYIYVCVYVQCLLGSMASYIHWGNRFAEPTLGSCVAVGTAAPFGI